MTAQRTPSTDTGPSLPDADERRGGTSLLGWFTRRRQSPIATIQALKALLYAEAALVAQKSIIGYCHVKTTLPLTELTREAAFRNAYDASRWEGFAAVLADLVVVVEGHLRPAAGERQAALADRLADVYAEILSEQPRPAEPGAGWAPVADEARHRLHRVRLAPPQPVAEVAWTSAGRLFRTLPIHDRLRAPDEEAVVAGVRFMLVSRCGRLERRLDPDRLVRALLDGG